MIIGGNGPHHYGCRSKAFKARTEGHSGQDSAGSLPAGDETY